jgi:hypothetical protein
MARTKKSAREVEDEIGVTRSRIGRRLTSLRSDLVSDMIFRSFSDGGSLGDLGRELGTAVRKHPLPAVVLGAGLLWLLSSRAASFRAEEAENPTAAYDNYPDEDDDDLDLEGDNSSLAERGAHYLREAAGAAAGAAAEKLDDAKELAAGAYGRARRQAHDAKEKLAEGVDAVGEGLGQLKSEARVRYRHAKRDVRRLAKSAPENLANGGRWVADHPLPVGIAFALGGAALASVIALSRREREEEPEEEAARPARARAASRKPASRKPSTRAAARNAPTDSVERTAAAPRRAKAKAATRAGGEPARNTVKRPRRRAAAPTDSGPEATSGQTPGETQGN